MEIHYNFENIEYAYIPEEDDFEIAIIRILCNKVKSLNKSNYEAVGAFQMAVYMIKLLKQDLDYDLSEMFGEWFEEELKQYFYQQALNQYNEDIAKQENDIWYDLHRHD